MQPSIALPYEDESRRGGKILLPAAAWAPEAAEVRAFGHRSSGKGRRHRFVAEPLGGHHFLQLARGGHQVPFRSVASQAVSHFSADDRVLVVFANSTGWQSD